MTYSFVIASEAKQSISPRHEKLDCFVASLLAMTRNIHPNSIHTLSNSQEN